MFEQKHPRNDFSCSPGASAGLALFATLIQLRLNNLQQLIVIECLDGAQHPWFSQAWFSQVRDFLGDKPIGEAALKTAGGDHASRSLDSSRSRRKKY
jgi:hypothetical protein